MKTIKLLYRWCKKQNKKLEKKRKNENENQRQTKLIIICGNNKVLYETLQKIVGDDDCVILTGFTKQMALYLKASDVCITKPQVQRLQLPIYHLYMQWQFQAVKQEILNFLNHAA